MSKEITVGRVSHLMKFLREKRVTEERFTESVKSGIFPDFLEALNLGTLPPRNEFRKMIGLDREVLAEPVETPSLRSLISACNLDWVNSNVTAENFPIPAGFQFATETKLFHFERTVSSEEVITEMKLKGWNPATIFDLLEFGAKNPELQRQIPIIALGSVCEIDSVRHVVYLRKRGAEREIRLHWFVRPWGGRFLFLAVRN